jgi:hypothetical protein
MVCQVLWCLRGISRGLLRRVWRGTAFGTRLGLYSIGTIGHVEVWLGVMPWVRHLVIHCARLRNLVLHGAQGI